MGREIRTLKDSPKEKVLYPFGYGLSYTKFEQQVKFFEKKEKEIIVTVSVKNIGSFAGKEVVQLYSSAPQGLLGKPERELKAFKKTTTLQPEEEQIVELKIRLDTLASYDDSGMTGHKSAYVLEAGEYHIYVGSDVRTSQQAGSFIIEKTMVVEQLKECLAPVKEYERLKPVLEKEGEEIHWIEGKETVPTRTIEPMTKREQEIPSEILYTGDQGYQLADVLDNKIHMDQFIAQLSEEDLVCLVHGEGMCSTKVHRKPNICVVSL